MVDNRSVASIDTFAGQALPKRVVYLVIFAVAWLLIGPRIPLASVAGSSVRLEDLLLLVLWIFVLVKSRAMAGCVPARRVVAIAVVGLFATALAVFAGRVSVGPGLLYSIRPLEYWAVFPALYYVLRTTSDSVRSLLPNVLAWITCLQVAVAALQSMFGIDFGFSKFSLERGAGLTAGPYELGAICSMLAVYWFSRYRYVLALVAAFGVLLSASRISIIGLAAGILIASISARRSRSEVRQANRKRFLLVTVVLIGFLVAGTVMLVSPMTAQQFGSPAVDRLQDTSTVDAWIASGNFSSGLSLPENAGEYDMLAYGNMPYLLGAGGFASNVLGEASDMVRFFRWHILLDLLNDPGRILFGLGPSFAGASVDGSYLRMLAETGIVGLGAWLACIRSWCRNVDSSVLGSLTALLIGAIFIDVVYSLRTMVLLWVLLAYADACRFRSENRA